MPSAESRAVVDEAAKVLLERPELLVVVEGHRDDRERDPTLGRRRAEAIVDMLVQAGVASRRLCVVDQGDTRPIAAATSDANRSRNRRVELRVVRAGESCP